jgi:hypothetical protein
LAGRQLNSRLSCADLREETPEDISNSGFLRFLRDADFRLDRALVLKQFLMTDAAGTAEVVLSIGLEVPACDGGEPPPEAAEEVSMAARTAFASLLVR